MARCAWSGNGPRLVRPNVSKRGEHAEHPLIRPLLAFVVVALTLGAHEPRTAPASVLVVSVSARAGGALIQDADVRIPAQQKSARTTSDGQVRFTGLEAGRYHVEIRAIGFSRSDVDVQVKGDSTAVHVELDRAKAAELDTIRVVDAKEPSIRLAAFETRRQEGIGRFLTEQQLADDRSRSMQWVLSTRFPGIAVKGKGIVSMQMSGLSGDNECPVLVYLDGMQMEKVSRRPLQPVDPSKSAGRAASMVGRPDPEERQIADLESIRPDEIVGVEVYSRTTAPQQYRPLGNYCKVVLIWTRL